MSLHQRSGWAATVALILVVCVAPALADWPEYIVECGADQPALLLVVPDGSGAPFTAARLPGGATVDATIRVRVTSASGDPIAGVPAEAMWLEWAAATFFACPGGTIADHETDADGWTEWSLPLRAGGHAVLPATQVVVWVEGAWTGDPSCPLQVNSPDISGDGQVSLMDIAGFAGDFYGAYHARSDFDWDGQLSLADIGRLAQGHGSGCP